MSGGKPLVVYHGTNKGGFDRFSKDKMSADNLYGPGFYFTEDEGIAQEYMEKGQEYGLNRPLVEKDMKKAKRWFGLKDTERAAYEDVGIRRHLGQLYRAWKAGPETAALRKPSPR